MSLTVRVGLQRSAQASQDKSAGAAMPSSLDQSASTCAGE